MTPSLARRLVGPLAALVLCTCGTFDVFPVDTTAATTIPGKSVLDDLIGIVTFDGFQDLDFSDQIANQGVTESQIDSVKLTTFSLRVTDPHGAKLDFLQSVKFYAEAEGQPRVLVASGASFAGNSEVELEVEEDVELKPYVVAASMTLSAEVVGQKPDQATTLEAEVTLSVDATVPGCE